tara:strand:+ start:310 stop:573 length:264 start_codon:yes stop_codon:yes gene_type:complete
MQPSELSATLSLHQRLSRGEDPRTIALAIRTFKRASIDKSALSNRFNYEKWVTIEPIIDELIKLSKCASFDKTKFMESANSLTTLLV